MIGILSKLNMQNPSFQTSIYRWLRFWTWNVKVGSAERGVSKELGRIVYKMAEILDLECQSDYGVDWVSLT